MVELNPDAAARLRRLAFESDGGAQVGRVMVPGRVAPAMLTIAGRAVPVTASSYPNPCCSGVDGEIAPDLLPFAEIRFIRGATGATRPISLRLERRPGFGLFTRGATAGGSVLVLFTLAHDATLATGAGAAALARAGGGHFTGTQATETRAFGIPRPVRSMTLDRPVALAGFSVDRLLVRTTDFRGDTLLPPIPGTTPPEPADIRVTARRAPPQRAIAAVTLGRDLLARCPDIWFVPRTRLLTLFCA